MTGPNTKLLYFCIYICIIFGTEGKSRTLHIEGHVDWVDVLDRRSSNIFEIQIDDCEWSLKTTYRVQFDSTNASNRSLNYSFDGTNTYFSTSAAWTIDRDQEDVLPLEIYPGNLPDYKQAPDTVAILWLIFCGGCYTSTNQEIPALLTYPVKSPSTERRWRVDHADTHQEYNTIHYRLHLSAQAAIDAPSIGDESLNIEAQHNRQASPIPGKLNYSYSVFTPAQKYRRINSATIHVNRVSVSTQLLEATPTIRKLTFVRHDGRFALSPTNQLTYLTTNGIPHYTDRVLSSASARIHAQKKADLRGLEENNGNKLIRRSFLSSLVLTSFVIILAFAQLLRKNKQNRLKI